jgi:FAD:protein FMN transferase
MGMPVTVQVLDPAVTEAVLDEVFEDFALLDQTFSPFLEGSAVSRINRGELALEEAGPLVVLAAELCRQHGLATAGYFSGWPGGRFEPSGLVKGWAIDRPGSILARHGLRDWFVDAGGDVLARGRNADGGPWRVGIRHPVERDKVVRVVLASDLAVATSGSYEKGDHILDPHTGRPAVELLSFTVVGPDILTADFYATACFAMGPRGLDFLAGLEGYEGLAIDRQLRGTWTAGFAEICERD